MNALRTLLVLCALAGEGLAGTPFIDSIVPPSTAPGSGPIIVTIHGGNFASGATVRFGATTLSPASASATSLSVPVPAAALSTAGTPMVTVSNPAVMGTEISNATPFPIATPVATFTAMPLVFGVSQPRGVITGDFNGDGHADIAVSSFCATPSMACTPATIRIFPGNGGGSFGAPIMTDVCSRPGRLTSGDLNGDGHLDLVLVCDSSFDTGMGGADILLGDGTGHFEVSFVQAGTNRGGVNDVATGDFNGDGKLDVLVSGSGDGPYLLTGNGDGTFTVGPGLCANNACYSPYWIRTGDFNGDGKLDFVSSFYYDTVVSVWIGDGAGHFTRSTIPVTGFPENLATADFNGDGKLDVAVAVVTFGTPGITPNSGYILLGDGAGNFTPESAPALLHMRDIAAGDLNNDQKPDVVGTFNYEAPDLPLVAFGNGDGTLRAATSVQALSSPEQPAIADFNEDGRLDVVLIDGQVNEIGVLIQLGAQTGGTQYSITDLCAPRSCSLTVLSDANAAAGINTAVVTPGHVLDAAQPAGTSFVPLSVNAAGDIAGYLVDSSGTQQAALWDTQTSTVLNLDPTFGWTHGLATYINDGESIVGYSPGQTVSLPMAPGHRVYVSCRMDELRVHFGLRQLGSGGLCAGKPANEAADTFDSAEAVQSGGAGVAELSASWVVVHARFGDYDAAGGSEFHGAGVQ